jgi:hypothetical protein
MPRGAAAGPPAPPGGGGGGGGPSRHPGTENPCEMDAMGTVTVVTSFRCRQMATVAGKWSAGTDRQQDGSEVTLAALKQEAQEVELVVVQMPVCTGTDRRDCSRTIRACMPVGWAGLGWAAMDGTGTSPRGNGTRGHRPVAARRGSSPHSLRHCVVMATKTSTGKLCVFLSSVLNGG